MYCFLPEKLQQTATLDRVAAGCRVLQCVTECCNMKQCWAACCSADKKTHAGTEWAIHDFCIYESCSVLQRVATCCSVCRSMLQHVLQCRQRNSCRHSIRNPLLLYFWGLQHVTACCSVLQRVALCCSIWQHVAVWTKRLTPTQKKRSVTSFGDFLALK